MRLLESTVFSDGNLDKDKGVVRGVKILGRYSAHGHEYSRRAMIEAVPLYEGKQVNVDHPQKNKLGQSRKYSDRFGRLHGIQLKEDGVYGDLHYNKKHSLAEQFEYDVENDPKNVGLSHNAVGQSRKKNGKVLVESIVRVRSVDLVADPATNVSLFEGKGMRVKRKKNEHRDLLEEFLEDSELDVTLDDLIESLVEDPFANIPEGKRELATKVVTLLESTEMDAKKTQQEMCKLFKEGKCPSEEDKGGVTEGRDELMEKMQQFERREEVKDLCEAEDFKPNAVQLKALMSLESDGEVKELIESLNVVSDTEGPFQSKRVTSKSASKSLLANVKIEDWLEGLTV